jgi:hypothetical protein
MKFNPLLGPSGKQVGAYQFAYDVTDRVRDQQRLAEATSQMHEMAKLETLGQLTGGVAHDFNNLLTPIVGALDMLRRQHEADERSNRLISGAMQAAERAATLVQRLLSFARRQHLEARTVDVKALVEGMHDLMQRTIGPHIAVRVDTAANVPAARVDPGQLELAVLNLAVNARDAMAGGGQIRLTLDEKPSRPATISACRSPTREQAWTRPLFSVRLSPSSLPRVRAKAPASACPWSMASLRSPAVPSRFEARSAAAPPRNYGSRLPKGKRRRPMSPTGISLSSRAALRSSSSTMRIWFVRRRRRCSVRWAIR